MPLGTVRSAPLVRFTHSAVDVGQGVWHRALGPLEFETLDFEVYRSHVAVIDAL